MLTLSNMFVLMLLAAMGAWLWHAHGVRERALLLTKQHCIGQGVQLLDENVALRGLRLVRDRNGRRRLAREYSFEFTVSGEERYNGQIWMFGRHLGRILLAPHRFIAEPEPEPTPALRPVPPAPPPPKAEVIRLDDWRKTKT